MKTATDFRFILSLLKGHVLVCDCGHNVSITDKGVEDTIVIVRIGNQTKIWCHNCYL